MYRTVGIHHPILSAGWRRHCTNGKSDAACQYQERKPGAHSQRWFRPSLGIPTPSFNQLGVIPKSDPAHRT
jgi:hypothetical protein